MSYDDGEHTGALLIMVSRINLFWLRHRWWAVSLTALALVALEIVEHRPSLHMPDLDFLREAMVLLVIPLASGWLLGRFAHRKPEPVHGGTSWRPGEAGVQERVLVVEHEMLGGLVKNLLDQMPGLNVIGNAATDQADLIKEIQRVKPQVVVMSKETGLIDPTHVLAQVKDDLDLRLVVLSMHDNVARIYDKRQALIRRSADLTAIISSWAI